MRGPNVHLRPPRLADEADFLAAVRRSRSLHRGWVSPPSTSSVFREYLGRCKRNDFRGFLVCRNDTGELVGVFNISQIFYGYFQSAYLGFYAFSGHEGQGLMREGLALMLKVAFGKLRLHRVEANVQPANARSIALVNSLGFRLEGFSPRYLKIGGRWKDHERWAILRDEFNVDSKN